MATSLGGRTKGGLDDNQILKGKVALVAKFILNKLVNKPTIF